MEKWIGHEEEGSVIPRCRGTPDRIEGSELRDTETPTQNNAIRVLAYTGHKWIVDSNGPGSVSVRFGFLALKPNQTIYL